MPILDPASQFIIKEKYGFSKDFNYNRSNTIGFFLNFLPIASRNIYRNFKTIEAYIQFKKDLKNSIYFLSHTLNCQVSESDLNNPSISNFYKYIYNHLQITKSRMIEIGLLSENGFYKRLNNQFSNNYFQYYIASADPKFHSWYFTDSPIAILSLHPESFRLTLSNDVIYQSIRLEIDLLLASGYTLVLCIEDISNTREFLFDLISRNQFSEIHVNITNSENFLKDYEKKYHDSLTNYKGYLYFYATFLSSNRPSIKKFKEMPRVTFISYSDELIKSIQKYDFLKIKPFPFCENGFDQQYLRVFLSNVPLFNTDEETSIPSQTSGLGIGYILVDEFLEFTKPKISIIFDDQSQNGHHFNKYIEFDDIHKIRPDLYVNDQLVLAKIDQSTLKKVEEIEFNINNKIIKRQNSDFKEDNIFSLFKTIKIKKSLEFVAYAYSYAKLLEGKKFFAHRTQIYTAYQACKKFIIKENDKNQKGVVFQVQTGEGKSCIVCLIASALSKMGKTVHITSSNMKLSIRDYEESFKFFKILRIKTALLIHNNELPSAVQKKFKLDNDSLSISKNEDQKVKPTLSSTGSTQDIQETVKSEASNDVDEEKDDFFKNNADSYFKFHTQNVEESMDECYSKEFYDPELFKNPSRMNFSVCGLNNDSSSKVSKNKADVIFSTFVNFECLYLKMVELYPGSVEPYFTSCSLLIDEADSILIDEIANGTIVSRSMKSNAVQILKFVYEQKKKGESYQSTFNMIKNNKKWSICKDLKEHHIKRMYEEIDIVHKPEYSNGQKYSIERIEVKNEKKMNKIAKAALNLAIDIGKDIMKNFVAEFTKDVKESKEGDEDEEDEDDDDDDDDDDDEDEEEEEENDDEKPTFFNYIVPFGYDKNGMLEPNKEFGGFIQQFIAIKESLDNDVKNMIVNDISMSYLYVSHPIFVKLYGTVCGFTGTIGNKADKKLLHEEYGLSTMKVPRHQPNLNVEFPILICQDRKERDERIVSEIIEFHEKGNPVLVIFQSLNEIERVELMLSSKGIKSINIFNGKDDILKPDEIAGSNGAISLGTNVCGRGTDIKAKGKPLHVIVSYFTSNTRIMGQAYGRTARQGKKGTYRTICTENQFFSPTDILTNIDNAMSEFQIKNQRQREFVDYFKSKRKWIFANYINKQVIDSVSIKELRKSKINVNRIVAYNYVFPICMSRGTFLKIQEQKIFSIFNCPNSQFTWRLFQRYIRELILESWSLLINELDIKYLNKTKGKSYDDELVQKRQKLYEALEHFLPNSNYEIVPTFMHIFRKVINGYEKRVFEGFTKMANPLIEFDKSSFFTCKVGFKPYALYSESGARIYSKNFKKTNFIKDPELKYERRTMKEHRFTIASITEKIDDIFNRIFMKVNEILGTKTFLKLFLRRTLAGCEFGFCLNLNIKNDNQSFIQNNPYCMIDLDPLLVFTIFVRSMIPVLAIILISVLVYIGSIAKKIAKWFVFPSNVKEAVKTTVSIVVDSFATNISSRLFDKIISFLEDNLDKNIEQLNSYDSESAEIIKLLKNIFSSKEAEKLTTNLSKHLGKLFKVKTNWGKLAEKCVDPVNLMKISVFIVLLIASFIMCWRRKKMSIEDYSKDSLNYLNDKSEENLKEIQKNIKNEFVLVDIEPNSDAEINEINEKVSNTYLYQMTACNIMKMMVKASDFYFNKDSLKKKAVSSLIKCIQKGKNIECLLMPFVGNRQSFLDQVLIYSSVQFPSILKFIGYDDNKKNKLIFLDMKEKGNLESFYGNKNISLDETQKLIISYGIARALLFLHDHKIVHRNVKPLNIYLDSNLYPYLTDFCNAKHVDKNSTFNFSNASIEYTAPEFITNFVMNQNSFKLDVYSFGLTILYLFTGSKPFSIDSKSLKNTVNDIYNGKRPEIPQTMPNEWHDLVEMCWNKDPNIRPDFKTICKILESFEFKNKRIDSKLFSYYRNEIIDRQTLQANND